MRFWAIRLQRTTSVALIFCAINLASIGLLKASEGTLEANLLRLSQSPMWLKLLRYERSSIYAGKNLSAVNSASFFLAPDGNSDPYQELLATVNALSLDAGQDQDMHAQCRFPARNIWLKQQLAQQANVSLSPRQPPKCKAYDEWTQQGDIVSISVVLATGFLANPASYFGHTLLKFNSERNHTRSELLDSSVNFGALVPQGENPAVYLAKGVFGGYSSNFTHRQYYYHDHNYTALESRDLWEFELDLSKEELQLIVAHAWELIGQEYTYFFFRKNCAYRMAEVLNLVEGVDLIPKNRGWTIPQSVVRKLYSTRRNGDRLVSNIRYHPSLLSEFHHLYQQLVPAEQRILKRITINDEELNSNAFISLPVSRQAKVLDALLRYLYYQNEHEYNDETPTTALYKRVLETRFDLPGIEQGGGKVPSIFTEGSKPGRSELNFIYNSDLNAGIELNLRPAYYDTLDSGPEQSAHSTLSVLDFKGVYLNDDLSMRGLELFSVESIAPSVSGLPGDDGATWSLKAGYEATSLACHGCSRFRVEAGKGRSWPIADDGIIGVELGAAVADNRYGYGNASAYLRLFSNHYINDWWSFRWSLSNRFFLDSDTSDRIAVEFESRRAIAKNIDIRLKLRKNQAFESALSMGYYW